MAVRNYRLKCRNPHAQCPEVKKAWTQNEFEVAFCGDKPGIACPKCSYPTMEVIKLNSRIKDTFEPGWQQNVRKYFRTYAEYKQYFKEHGLVELGYEEFDEKPEDDSIKWSKEMAKKGATLGLSDRQLDALRQGKTISDKGKLKENLEKLENYEKSL